MMTKIKLNRPGFIGAAALTALIVTFGLVLAIRHLVASAGGDPDPTSPSPATTAPSASSAPSTDSICGLTGIVESGSAPKAPDTQWMYQETIAYPASDVYGPGETSPEGVRYCFQHSPEGALFAAANGVSQGSGDSPAARLDYFLSVNAPNRDQLVEDGKSPEGTSTNVRVNTAGYRILSYDADTAYIDIAIRGVGLGVTVRLIHRV